MANTNHSVQIERLRRSAENPHNTYALENRLAADLLELHDRTSLSLDKWASAREFVEQRVGGPIQENGV